MSKTDQGKKIVFATFLLEGKETLQTELIDCPNGIKDISTEMLGMIIVSSLRLLHRKGCNLDKVMDLTQQAILSVYPDELQNMMKSIAGTTMPNTKNKKKA